MKLARLTDSGILQFSAFLQQLRDQPTLKPPTNLLSDQSASELITSDVVVEDRLFRTRFDAAVYLDGVLLSAGLSDIEADVGLWAWLALFYFDQICPPKKDGKRKVAVTLSYIPQFVSQRYYRHLLLGPWSVLQPHRAAPEKVLALLSSPMDVATSEIFRLFIENPTLLVSDCAVGTATRLYFDSKVGKLKRGASGKTGTGHCRRLIAYLQQIDLTHDLHTLTEEHLTSMLPREFAKFLSHSGQLPL